MKLNKISILAICGLLMAGCSLDRTYLNGPSSETFPATKGEAEAGLFAAYKTWSSNTMSMAGTPFIGVLDNVTDIGALRYTQTALMTWRYSQIETTSSQVRNVYSTIYRAAGRIHLVLDNIDRLKDELSDEEFNALKAELVLLRDFGYEWGAQLFGDMLFIDHSLSLNDYKYPRIPYMENVKRILEEDLTDEVLDWLPVRHNKSEYGDARLGRVGGYGMKARFALHWAHEDNALWAEAARCADKALKLAEGVYRLEPYNFAFVGADHQEGEPSVSNLFGMAGHRSSDEWIWATQHSIVGDNTHQGGNYASPRTLGGTSYWGPTQEWIDAVQCKDGLSIVESPLYNYKQPWKNRDPRLDLYAVRPNSRLMGVEFQTAANYATVHNYNTGVDIENVEAVGSNSQYGSNGARGPAGYLWRKYIDREEFDKLGGTFSGGPQCTLSYPLMRLAELYLIRAEANIEMEGGDLQLAQDDINIIRERAGMPRITTLDRNELRSALRYERMVELCNEGHRWFDIRRWGIANLVMNGPIHAPSQDKSGPWSNAIPTIDENWHVTYDGSTWDGEESNIRVFCEQLYLPDKDIHLPIPDQERQASGIEQNAGY